VSVDQTARNVLYVTVYSDHQDVVPDSKELYQVDIYISRPLFLSWYAFWTDPAKKLLEEHLILDTQSDKKITCALLTGGGAKSREFRKQMDTVLSKEGIQIGAEIVCNSPCSAGALLQHFFRKDTLPPNAHFYISQTECYDKDKHSDAKRKKSLIHQSKFDTTQHVVYHRLRRVMQSSKESDVVSFVSEGYIPQVFYVEAGEKFARIHIDLFWSLKNISQHQPLNTPQGKRRRDVRSYPLMFIDYDTFRDNGFQVFQDDDENNGTPHFVVKGFVRMEGTNESLVFTVYLMKHYYEFPPHALDVQPFADDDVLKQHKDEVWHKSSSHFVSSSSGVERSPPSVAEAPKRQRVAVAAGSLRKSARIVRAEDEMDVSV
jgi:hypothetical protein